MSFTWSTDTIPTRQSRRPGSLGDTIVMPVSLFSNMKYGPQFPGGKEELIKFINDHLQYPQEAQEKNNEGSVWAVFTVNPDGNVIEIKKESGPYTILIDEVLRVLRLLPSFIPGETPKNPIKFQYRVLIKFSLEKSPDGDEVRIPLVEVDEGKPKEAFSPIKKPEEENSSIFTVVESMPEFPGGEEALMKYISEKVRYPEEAQELGLQGRVSVSFVVNRDGSVVNIEIVNGIDPLLDLEAIRLIKQMPRWAPGNPRHKPVRVRFTLPINFRLPKEGTL